MEDVEARGELLEGQGGLAGALAAAGGADLYAVVPVLAAVVVGVVEVDPHHVGGVQGDAQHGDGMPANEAGGAVGDRDARRLGVDQRLVAVVVGDRKSTRLNSSHVRISYAV